MTEQAGARSESDPDDDPVTPPQGLPAQGEATEGPHGGIGQHEQYRGGQQGAPQGRDQHGYAPQGGHAQGGPASRPPQGYGQPNGGPGPAPAGPGQPPPGYAPPPGYGPPPGQGHGGPGHPPGYGPPGPQGYGQGHAQGYAPPGPPPGPGGPAGPGYGPPGPAPAAPPGGAEQPGAGRTERVTPAEAAGPGTTDAVTDETAEGGADADVAVLSERVADDLRRRWDDVQTKFVDRPREAVGDADGLVGDALDELGRVFREQRASLEQRWDDDATSTEDLRQALFRYREFFDRLLAL